MCLTQVNRMIAFCLFLITLFVSAAFPDDIDSLQNRLSAEYVKGDTSGVVTYLSQQRADGSWGDINYADRARSVWAPQNHVSRLTRMAVAYHRPDHPKFRDTTLLNGIKSGLDYWYANDAAIYSSNWWYNDIGQQLELGPLLIMMEAHLDSARIFIGSTFLKNPSMTGQNLIWFSQQTIWRGCLRKSLSDITTGLNAIKNEVRITTGEGIQPDFSFHQHGPQLYSGGYGRGFLEDISFWIVMSQGLSFAFDTVKAGILTGFALDGSQWMVRRNNWDFACSGREIVRPGCGPVNNALKDRLSLLQSSRQAELRAFVAHTNGINDTALVGDKHFWRSDYHVTRAKNFHFSVRMCSNRTVGTEGANDENKKNYYLPFGCTYILCQGDEYYNIFPIWDWGRIPGVTSPHKPNPGWSGNGYLYGTTSFVGGASNGKCGAAGFELNWDGITGRKAWFCFGDQIVAIGAGISGNSTVPVYTSINQCRLSGEVSVRDGSDKDSVYGTGLRTIDNPRYVYHDSVGYVFPNPSSVTLKNESQNGSWYAINSAYSADVVTGDVFSLWLDHGINPVNADYEYIILPGRKKNEVQDYALHIPIRTLSNTIDLQAVRHDTLGAAGIVFYKAGRVNIRFGLAVEVDKPCIVLLDEFGVNYKVTVANPLNTALTVSVNLMFNGEKTEQMVFALPTGNDAGKSLTLTSVSTVGVDVPKGYVRVTVNDAVTGQPLEGVLIFQEGNGVNQVYSDSQGIAYMSVDSDFVILQCSKPLYTPRLDSLIVPENDTLSLEFSLSPIALSPAIQIYPDADAHVRAGTYASTNYGGLAVLEVKRPGTVDDYTRESYLKFNLEALPDREIVSARLKLYSHSVSADGAASYTIQCHAVADDGWGETAITWTNKPPAGALLGALSMLHADTAKWVEFDVTANIAGEYATDKTATVRLSANTGSNVYQGFRSREYPLFSPVLEVVTVEDNGTGMRKPTDVAESLSMSVSPNPFNPVVNIAVAGRFAPMRLLIFDLNGKVVANLTSILKSVHPSAGVCRVSWDASQQASGVYVVMLKSGENTFITRALLVR